MIVAVPQAWLDVETMADLEAAGASFRAHHGRRLRVATKYMALTRRFFAEKSVGEIPVGRSAGATEAAPAAGTAEVIVDNYIDRRNAEGQWPENFERWRDAEKPGCARRIKNTLSGRTARRKACAHCSTM